jgi:hypothetical protein
MRQRHELIARVMQMRRGQAAGNPAVDAEFAASPPDTVSGLEDRLAHLEKMIDGLQDSVHRESTRQRQQIAELEAALEPAALEIALSGDARRRGL